MPMCSRIDAICMAVNKPITKLYKCPFEAPSGYCDVCDECNVVDEIENPMFPWEDDDEEDDNG